MEVKQPINQTIKTNLILEKRRVVEMEKEYEPEPTSQFIFLGKGGYSRVFKDRKTEQVFKMIKARKLKSKTSLNSIRQELLWGSLYRNLRNVMGTAVDCYYDMK